MIEMSGEKKNPDAQIEAFVNWVKEDWAHIALVIVAILFIIVLIAMIARGRK